MPKLPMDYSKCCIYKIEHIDDESLVYVGHTTNFDKRKTAHKGSCKNDNHKHYNFKVYQMIRENGGWEKFLMLEVEKYPCADKREAERRENEVIKEVRASMNTYKSFITKDELTEYHKEYNKEFYEANKPKIQERRKEYYEANKQKILHQMKEYNKEFYEANKPKIQEYHKEYYEANKQKIQERSKDYRDNNKLKIQKKKKDYRDNNKLKLNEKVKCECGCEINKSHLNRHQATTKHLDKLKNI